MPQIAEPITSLEQELESRIEWLENGLKEIANKTLGLDDMIQAVLDGEPTTADEHNVVRISDVNKEIAEEWNRDREKKINMVQSIGYKGED